VSLFGWCAEFMEPEVSAENGSLQRKATESRVAIVGARGGRPRQVSQVIGQRGQTGPSGCGRVAVRYEVRSRFERRLCALLVLALAATGISWVAADPIDQHTVRLLEALIAGQRDNRSRILDLQMDGAVSISESGEEQQILFSYFELGDKRRVDLTYPAESARKGETYRWAVANGRSLCHIPETGSTRVMPPVELQMQSDLAYLDTLAVSRQWRTHVGHLEHLLHRGWEPENQSIAVESENIDGDEVLLRVSYTSTRGGGRTNYEWSFAPERGYEVVSAQSTSTRPDGGMLSKVSCRYDVREVEPGVWRAVGVERQSENWNPEGQHWAVQTRIKTSTVAANTGRIEDAFFTLGGLGVKPGTLVTDFTLSPPTTYEYQARPILETEFLLDDALGRSEGPSAENQQSVPMDQPAISKSADAGDHLGGESLRHSEWSRIAVWSFVLFGAGAVVGYLIACYRWRGRR